MAQLLLALTDTLLLRGEPAGLEPKRLRHRALHTAGRLAFHARCATLRPERRRPWAEELAGAFARLAEPAGAGRLSAGRSSPEVERRAGRAQRGRKSGEGPPL